MESNPRTVIMGACLLILGGSINILDRTSQNLILCTVILWFSKSKSEVDWEMNIKLVAKTTGPLGKTIQCIIYMCISRSFLFNNFYSWHTCSLSRQGKLICLTTSLNVQGQFTYSSCGFWKEFESIREWNISKSPIHKSTLSS